MSCIAPQEAHTVYMIITRMLLWTIIVGISIGAGFLIRGERSVVLAPEDTAPTSTEGTVTETTSNSEALLPEEEVSTPIPTPSRNTLDLSSRSLRTVPEYVFDARSTQVLNLSNNLLTSVQAEIRHLTKLTTLDLSNNTLTNIPAELGQLSNLEVLDLKNNKLTGLPYELGNLRNLRTLDLRGNAYASADLEIIKKSLSQKTVVLVD